MDMIMYLGQLAREEVEALANLLGPKIVGADIQNPSTTGYIRPF
jgi:hypothetical protein